MPIKQRKDLYLAVLNFQRKRGGTKLKLFRTILTELRTYFQRQYLLIG
ncbi:MAG: hypothetical protein IPK06_17650 [Ignavibacteriae bacterium]|nr:hypothetical protein [Ignavibacteriota bacterium]